MHHTGISSYVNKRKGGFTMGKRGEVRGFIPVMSVLIFILMASVAYAEHSASVSVQPLQLYETITDVFDLRIINTGPNLLLGLDILEDNSNRTITNVSIVYEDFTLLASTIPSDWKRSLANDILSYANGKISSGETLVFAIQAKADRVDANMTSVWKIITKDMNNDTAENNIEILIINDDTPPVLSDPLPYDGMFIKTGISSQDVRINAYDNETGVAQVNFNYADMVNLSDVKNAVLSTATANLYESAVDLSDYPDSTIIGFSFNALNNGGNYSYYPGSLTIDGQPPSVDLIAPGNNAMMNSQSDFEFNAYDKLSPSLDCGLLIDSIEQFSLTVANNTQSSISVANASEGRHAWSVMCLDLAGWNGTSETRIYTLDRTAPVARIVSPIHTIIPDNTNINFAVTDNFGLDGVWYSFSHFNTDNPNYVYENHTLNKSEYIPVNESQFTIEAINWEEGMHDISVYADDPAGNNYSDTFAVIIDKTAPNITLISPVNETDVNANFTFDVVDNYDPIIDCQIYINDTVMGSASVNTTANTTATMMLDLLPAMYQWKISCQDDAGNSRTSDVWNVTVIDRTGPEITFNNLGIIVRGNDIIVDATVSDISGVNQDTLHATIETPEIATLDITLTRDEGTDSYTASFPTTVNSALGDYIVRIYAEDNVGNSNSYYGIYGLTYGYVLTLSVASNPAQTGQQVTASGTVLFDNGSLVPEQSLSLALPDAAASPSIDAAGAFSHIFNAPGTAANYTITASITPANGITFIASVQLEVQNPPAPADKGSGGNGGDGSGSGSSTGGDDDDGHSPGICPNCGPCESDSECGSGKMCYKGYCFERECGKESDCGNGKQCNNGRCVGQGDDEPVDEYFSQDAGQLYHYCTDGTCDSDESCKNCPEDCGECASGLGTASGFFDLSKVSSSMWILILILAVMAFVLVYLYQYGPPQISMPQSSGLQKRPIIFGRKDNLKLEKYLKERREISGGQNPPKP